MTTGNNVKERFSLFKGIKATPIEDSSKIKEQIEEIGGVIKEGDKDALKDYNTELVKLVQNSENGEIAVSDFYQTQIQSAQGFIGTIKALRTYNAVSEENVDTRLEFAKAVGATNTKLGDYMTSLNGAKAGLGGFITQTAKAAAAEVGLTIATAALNTALSFGIGFAISALVAGITKLTHAYEDYQQAIQDDIDTFKERTDKMKEENDAVDELVSKYTEIVTSTDDLTGSKEELLSIQQSLTDSFGSEVEGLDLLNESYAKNIELIRQKRQEEAESFKKDNENKYEKNKKFVEGKSKVNVDNPYTDDPYAYGIFNDAKGNYTKIRAKGWSDFGDARKIILDRNKYKNTYLTGEGGFGDYNTLYVDGTVEEQIRTLEALYNELSEFYKDAEPDSNEQKWLKAIEQRADTLREQFDKATDSIKEYESVRKYSKSSKLSDDTQTKIDKARDIGLSISDDDTSAELLKKKEEYENLKQEIYNAIGKDKNAKELIDTQFDEIDKTLLENFGDLSDKGKVLIQSIQKFKDETYDEITKKRDTYDSAISSLIGGEDLKESDVFSLIQLDTNLADRFTKTADGYKISIEELMTSRNNFLEVQKNNANSEIEQNENYIKDQQALLDDARKRFNEASKYKNRNNTKEVESARSDINKYTENINKATENTKEWKTYLELIEGNLDTLAAKAEEASNKIIKGLEKQKEKEEALLDSLNARKEVLEDMISQYESAANAVTRAIDEQISELESQKQAVEDKYNSEIEALQKENDERDRNIDLREKEIALEKAKNSKVRVYDAARGWTVQRNEEDLIKADVDYKDAKNNVKIAELEEQRDKEAAVFDERIAEYENYKAEWEKVLSSYQNMQDEMNAATLFGSNWRERILNKDTNMFGSFVADYGAYQTELHSVIEPQIKDVQNLVKSYDAQITAQNQLKETFNDFLSNYAEYSNAMTGFVNAQREAFEKLAAAQQAANMAKVGISAVVENSGLNNIKGSYASGGIVDYTGLAQVHGTRSKPEMVLNAEQLSRLWKFLDTGKPVKNGTPEAQAVIDKFERFMNSAPSFNSPTMKNNSLLFDGIPSFASKASVEKITPSTSVDNSNNSKTWNINGEIVVDSYEKFKGYMDRYARELQQDLDVNKR